MEPYAQRKAEAESYYANAMKHVSNSSAPANQKFPIGSFVRIADKLGSRMSHFTSGVFAQVQHTHGHAFGGPDVDSYSLLVRRSKGKWSSSAWYHEPQLTLVTDQDIINLLTDDKEQS